MTTLILALLLQASPVRPVATYSIVARDPQTGQMGVAVQSHWFSVGSMVSWAEAGVGAVATQSFVDPAYGPMGLDLMRAGKSAPEALRALLVTDEQQDVRLLCLRLGGCRCQQRRRKRGDQQQGRVDRPRC